MFKRKRKSTLPEIECELTEKDFNLCEKIVDHLEQLSYEELLEIGISVYEAHWGTWVEGIPYKPDDWESKQWQIKKYFYYSIRGVIDECAGIKAVYRHKRVDLTEQQFEDWWDSVTETRFTRLEEKLNDGKGYADYAQYERYDKICDCKTILFYLFGFSVGCLIAYLHFRFKC